MAAGFQPVAVGAVRGEDSRPRRSPQQHLVRAGEAAVGRQMWEDTRATHAISEPPPGECAASRRETSLSQWGTRQPPLHPGPRCLFFLPCFPPWAQGPRLLCRRPHLEHPGRRQAQGRRSAWGPVGSPQSHLITCELDILTSWLPDPTWAEAAE